MFVSNMASSFVTVIAWSPSARFLGCRGAGRAFPCPRMAFADCGCKAEWNTDERVRRRAASALRHLTLRQTTSIGNARRSFSARPEFAVISSASSPWIRATARCGGWPPAATTARERAPYSNEASVVSRRPSTANPDASRFARVSAGVARKLDAAVRAHGVG